MPTMDSGIPFEDIGIPQDVAEHIVSVIDQTFLDRPNASIDVGHVSQETGHKASIVKKVFYTLLAFRLLRATFLPRHRVCGYIIGPEEQSVEEIRQKAIEGRYACLSCHEPIDTPQDVEIQIVFWKPGGHGAI